ncbi:hypothetical protein AB4144_47110, partial [Rhizobiaceae sp. 2RAB30]
MFIDQSIDNIHLLHRNGKNLLRSSAEFGVGYLSHKQLKCVVAVTGVGQRILQVDYLLSNWIKHLSEPIHGNSPVSPVTGYVTSDMLDNDARSALPKSAPQYFVATRGIIAKYAIPRR